MIFKYRLVFNPFIQDISHKTYLSFRELIIQSNKLLDCWVPGLIELNATTLKYYPS
ncbi:protein of unknown function [Legionella pneumophila subsp. pneumophila]|uniref:Uncharacterized protein n=1 Tax=Legionella pneumophila subsp. pneumophila TaxID=91891 RepID=A0AAV2V0B2_LEGPN|nr:protein of unknown function [Legionella pneumophila subsp. pneumophila]